MRRQHGSWVNQVTVKAVAAFFFGASLMAFVCFCLEHMEATSRERELVLLRASEQSFAKPAAAGRRGEVPTTRAVENRFARVSGELETQVAALKQLAAKMKTSASSSSSSSTTPQQQQQGAGVAANGRYFHFVLNTDCVSFKSHWTSLSVVHTFLKTQHPSSKITELISCDKPDFKPAYDRSDRVDYMLCPLWSPHPTLKDHYPPYNKPKSMMHWLASKRAPGPNAVIVVVDPDQLLLRPFAPRFMNIVKPGVAIANLYGFGTQWFNGVLGTPEVCPKCSQLNQAQKASYIVGTPVIMDIADMRRVAPLWLKYTEMIRGDKARKDKAGWIAEMYGYVLGTIQADVRHETRTDLMASNAVDGTEFRLKQPHYTLHYCQEYKVGEQWRWNKHDYHQIDVLGCQTPLFEPPPMEVTGKVNTRAVWFGYTIITTLNEMLDEYKRVHCPKWPPDSKHDHKFRKDVLERMYK